MPKPPLRFGFVTPAGGVRGIKKAMTPTLTKGTGNQVRNRDKAVEIALQIYDNSYKTANNNSDINIEGKIYRVAAYANPKSKYALVNTVEAHKNNEPPAWYTDDKAGTIIAKQMADGRVIFLLLIKRFFLIFYKQTAMTEYPLIGVQSIKSRIKA